MSRTPAVRMGKPYENTPGFYREYPVDDITIWASKDVVPDKPGGVVRIGLERFLLARDITISGAQVTVREL